MTDLRFPPECDHEEHGVFVYCPYPPEHRRKLGDKPSRIIYVAGPMRNYHDFNFPAFDAASKRLREAGWIVNSPAEHDRESGFDETQNTLEGFDIHAAFAWDMDVICHRADAIYMLEGWEGSIGARIEHDVAKFIGLEIIYETDYSTDSVEDIPGRASVLREAEKLTCGDRNNSYGPPTQDFARTAAIWTAMFDHEFSPADVAKAMIALKLSRLTWSEGKRDSWVDVAGYAGCGFECAASTAS